MNDHTAAHKHSSCHYDEIMRSEICGCFYCLETFPPSEIKKWIDETDSAKTAVCPYCGIDSVIGSESKCPITQDFLKKMHDHWFSVPSLSKRTMMDVERLLFETIRNEAINRLFESRFSTKEYMDSYATACTKMFNREKSLPLERKNAINHLESCPHVVRLGPDQWKSKESNNEN